MESRGFYLLGRIDFLIVYDFPMGLFFIGCGDVSGLDLDGLIKVE